MKKGPTMVALQRWIVFQYVCDPTAASEGFGSGRGGGGGLCGPPHRLVCPRAPLSVSLTPCVGIRNESRGSLQKMCGVCLKGKNEPQKNNQITACVKVELQRQRKYQLHCNSGSVSDRVKESSLSVEIFQSGEPLIVRMNAM